MKPLHLSAYDHIIVAFSGGADSLACLLLFRHLLHSLDQSHKLEAWHHCVDGDPYSPPPPVPMDWPITRSYVTAVCTHLNVPLYLSWKHGGIHGELFRQSSPTAPISFESPTGIRTVSGRPTLRTRLKWPAVSSNLNVRWCSPYFKIDVATRALNNDPRFNGKTVLLITGERREEGGRRKHYEEFIPHKSTSSVRIVYQYRPILDMTNPARWEVIRSHGIRPHPAYYIGWGRVSCMTCIFGDKNQWASVRKLAEDRFELIAETEDRLQHTINHEGRGEAARGVSVREIADRGQAYEWSEADAALAMSEEYPLEMVAVGQGEWRMPNGAMNVKCGGPT